VLGEKCDGKIVLNPKSKTVTKMIAETFTNKIHTLTPELQTIRADYRVTAGQNID
jgi:hypothetical protein